MLRHNKILILTGAGVSVDSGIPTFRGTGGLYTNGFTYKGKKYQP
jgi:NAD-dependent deacetylase